MAYVSASGSIQPAKSRWRLSAIYEFILMIINFIVFFFVSLFSPGTGNKFSTSAQEKRKFDGRGGGKPGEDRRIGRIESFKSTNAPCAPSGG